MEKQIVITGIACSGKTTLLKNLKSKYPTLKIDHTDYFEDLQKYPQIKERRWLYQDILRKKEEENYVICRSRDDEFIYRMILELYNKWENEEDWCSENEEIDGTQFLNKQEEYVKEEIKQLKLLQYTGERKILVFLWISIAAMLLERMKKRNNGIDIMNVKYIRLQNFVYRIYAEEMKGTIIWVASSDSEEDLVKEVTPHLVIPTVPRVHYVDTLFHLQRMSEGAAGCDIPIPRAIVIGAGEVVTIKTGLIVEIPQGYYGQIKNRSSNVLLDLWVFEGVVDGDYRGEITLVIKNAGGCVR